jgi:hypothetical protein
MAEGLRIVASHILSKSDASIEDAFGILIPQVWKSLVAAGEDKVSGANDLKPNTLQGGSVYEFASLFMFMRSAVFNLDKNQKIADVNELQGIVYTHWDELFAQSFLQVLMARPIGAEFLGKPDPDILPINQQKAKKGEQE